MMLAFAPTGADGLLMDISGDRDARLSHEDAAARARELEAALEAYARAWQANHDLDWCAPGHISQETGDACARAREALFALRRQR